MKRFELSSRAMKNGRRKFKVVLCEVFPESTIDEVNEVGTEFNKNGISWIDTYVERVLDTIPGTFLRAEFLDEDRTELCGHGATGMIDGMPIFEDAVSIGVFTKGYIDTIDVDGEEKSVCIGEGEIDALCYNNFCKKLAKDISNGSPPHGSVEILKAEGNDAIIYKYGYVPEGRIPMEFQFSGYALLGVTPADDAAYIVELNNKEDIGAMTDVEIKALVSQAVEEMSNHTSEINLCKENCEKQIAEANALVETATAEKNEAEGKAAQYEQALEECRNELGEAYKKIDQLYAEMDELRKKLAEAQAKERVGELNAQIQKFTEEERELAKDEIEAFHNDPINSEINSVVEKIYAELGKKAKADEAAKAQVVAEQNAANDVDDIFGEVTLGNEDEDDNIF